MAEKQELVSLFDFDKTIIGSTIVMIGLLIIWVLPKSSTPFFLPCLTTLLWCDLRIVSDANTFFIETILKHHGVLHCFSEINTNSAIVDEDGRLRISPFHDFNSSSHGCNLCPPNLCKGEIFTRIQASSLEKRFIYVGDGKNDYCPSLKLTVKDYVMPRKHFPLWDAICIDPALIKASIHEWEDGEELERSLIQLISSLMIMKADEVLIAEEYLFADCKSDHVAAPESFQKSVPVPH